MSYLQSTNSFLHEIYIKAVENLKNRIVVRMCVVGNLY